MNKRYMLQKIFTEPIRTLTKFFCHQPEVSYKLLLALSLGKCILTFRSSILLPVLTAKISTQTAAEPSGQCISTISLTLLACLSLIDGRYNQKWSIWLFTSVKGYFYCGQKCFVSPNNAIDRLQNNNNCKLVCCCSFELQSVQKKKAEKVALLLPLKRLALSQNLN